MCSDNIVENKITRKERQLVYHEHNPLLPYSHTRRCFISVGSKRLKSWIYKNVISS
jgi:hypothetical protein